MTSMSNWTNWPKNKRNRPHEKRSETKPGPLYARTKRTYLRPPRKRSRKSCLKLPVKAIVKNLKA